MPNPPTIINGQLVFVGALAGQVAVQAQPVAGNNLIFNLPNTVPNPNAVLSVIAVTGSTVTFGFAPPAPQSFSFSQITGTISTSQLGSVEGNGSKVQLTTGSAPPSPVTTALLTAAGYTLLGGSAVTNSDGSSTVINGGNIGSYPTNTITPGTPAWTLDGGTAVVTAVAQNQTDLAAAIAAYQALGPGTTIPTALDGQSLAPGTYSSLSGTFTLSGGTLTLNGAGVYVFLAATTLTLTGASQIVLTNGATAANVVFVCGSSMTAAANSGTQFNGNILASVSITVDGGVYNGRLLAHTGAVTISTATVINAPIQGGVIAAGDVVIYDANGNVVSSGVLLSSLGGAAGVTSFNGRSGAVAPTSGDYTVSQVTGAAPLASPALSGVPTAPIAAPLTDSTQVATTAYADAAVAVETSRATTAEALLAPKASPTFTGTVTLPAGTYAISISGNAATATTAGTISGTITSSQVSDLASHTVTSFNSRQGVVSPTSGDYSVGQVTGAAPLASPTFTGTVTTAAISATSVSASTFVAVTGNLDLSSGHGHIVQNSDIAGTITVNTGAPSGSYTILGTYASAPIVVASPTNDPAAAGATSWWVTSSTSTITINVSGTTTAPIVFNYVAMGN